MFDFLTWELILKSLYIFGSGVVYLIYISASGYLLLKVIDRYRFAKLEKKVGDKVTLVETIGNKEAPTGSTIVATSMVVSESLLESIFLLWRVWVGGESPHRLMRRNHYIKLLELQLKEQAASQGFNRISNVRYYSSDISPRYPTPLGDKGLLELFVIGMASHQPAKESV